MEGILTFFYWQTLSINEFDSLSHFLRVLGLPNTPCSPYTADARTVKMGGTPATEAIPSKCNSWLGPFQPGVNAPDPTRTGSSSAAAAAGRTAAKKRGEVRGRGQPEAGPLPGQTDYSVPHPTLPPSVQSLLDALGGGKVPNTPSVPQPSVPQSQSVDPTQALDFLLGP
jgi:hypothetical protein